MKCQQCKSKRLNSILAGASDRFSSHSDEQNYQGYVPEDMGIGGGDNVKFTYCMNCGQIQGKFPVHPEVYSEEDE